MDDPRDGGASGNRSDGGSGGVAGAAGSAGKPQAGAGAAGGGGAEGGAGAAGAAGTAGSAGSAGTAGTAGSGGTAGTCGAGAACICTPNAFGCTKNLGVHAVTRCNPTGTLLVVIQSCGLYQYCEDGACHTQVCSPNSFYCAERELRHCDENGASYVVEQMCNGQERCDADAMDCVTDCRPEGCSCTMGFAPCCMANGACGCAIQGLGCNATFATGNERCFCP